FEAAGSAQLVAALADDPGDESRRRPSGAALRQRSLGADPSQESDMDERALRAPRLSRPIVAALAGLLLSAGGSVPASHPQESVTPAPVTTERPEGRKPRPKRARGADRDARRAHGDTQRWADRGDLAAAGDVDPRFIEYRKLLAAIAAGKDSV